MEFADPIFSDGTVPVTVSCSPKSGSQFRIGTTTVACSATNVAQELFSCTTTVTVTDRPKLSNGGGIVGSHPATSRFADSIRVTP